jgi:hypothetical protein
MSALVALEPQQEQTFFSVITEQEQKSITDEIICGRELKFNYINGDKLFELMDTKGIEKKNLRYIDILKYNYNQIFSQIVSYFPDIKINKFENSPCANECVNFNIDTTYKYGIYIVLAKEEKSFEYGFDFFSSSVENQENKYEHSKILLDNYEYFYSEDISSNKDIKRYLDETLFKLMVAICSITDDEYKLAEILFAKTNKDKLTPKQLAKELGYFLKIINWKKVDCIDLEDLYDDLELVNDETEEKITLKEFKKIIKTMCEKNEIKFDAKQKDLSFEIFELFLLNNNNMNSRALTFYKKSYQQSLNMLMQSLKLIIQLTNEMNMRKKFFSRYISFLIEYKLSDYKNQNIFNKIYLEKINDKKELFEKLFNQINAYCNKNKHNEDKLDKIKSDFDLLYDEIFNV